MREFVPLVQMREVQVSLAGGDQASPFLQVVQTRLVVLAVPMVVQPFLEPAVLRLGAAVPGLFQMVALPVLYLLEVVLLGLLVALVFQGVRLLRVLVFLGEQILVALVFRGVLALAALVFRGARFLV